MSASWDESYSKAVAALDQIAKHENDTSTGNSIPFPGPFPSLTIAIVSEGFYLNAATLDLLSSNTKYQTFFVSSGMQYWNDSIAKDPNRFVHTRVKLLVSC
jgi:hypothetical protein